MIYKAPIDNKVIMKHGDIIIGCDNQLYLVSDSINSGRTYGCSSCSFYKYDASTCRKYCREDLFSAFILGGNPITKHHSCICGGLLMDFCKKDNETDKCRCYSLIKIQAQI